MSGLHWLALAMALPQLVSCIISESGTPHVLPLTVARQQGWELDSKKLQCPCNRLIYWKKISGYFSHWFLWFACDSLISLKDKGLGPFPWEEAIPFLLNKSTLFIHRGPSELWCLGKSSGATRAADSMLPGVPKVIRSRVSFWRRISQSVKSSQRAVPFPIPKSYFLP